MSYAKLIDGEPIFAPNPIRVGGNWIGNPPGEVYLAEGYKAVRYTDPPGEPDAGYEWVEKWTETETAIVQGWELAEIPISEEDALTRYANELTGSEDETLTEATETLIKKLKEGN
jgi:hypothetical protein